MNWEEIYKSIRKARSEKNNALAFQLFDKAKKEFHSNSEKNIDWLIEALESKEKKFFVASFFQKTSMPKKLLNSMIKAAILEENPSYNNEFIKACLNSFDRKRIIDKVWELKEKSQDISKVLYWLGG